MKMSKIDPNILKELKITDKHLNSDTRIPLGTKIGRVIVNKYLGFYKGEKTSNHYYSAYCTCGCTDELIFTENTLKNIGKPGRATTISCGCAGIERTKKMQQTRKKNKYTIKNKAATIYYSIRERCYCTTYKKYPIYGGRGIKMCPEWENLEHGLDNFCDWMYNVAGYSDDLGSTISVDRIDNNGPYSPDNCHLSTNNGQASNKSQNVNHIWYNQLYNSKDLCNHYGCNYDRFRRLYYNGRTIHDILFGPKFETGQKKINMIANSPNGLIVTPRAFVIEPFRFADHSEVGPRNKWRPRSYNNFCPNEESSNQTLTMLADKYRIAERDAGRPVKPFQFTNSGSTDFLLSTNIPAELYNF